MPMSHSDSDYLGMEPLEWCSILSPSCVSDLGGVCADKLWSIGDNLGSNVSRMSQSAQESVGHRPTPNSRELFTPRPGFARLLPACKPLDLRRGLGMTEERWWDPFSRYRRPLSKCSNRTGLSSHFLPVWSIVFNVSLFPCHLKTMTKRLMATSFALKDTRRQLEFFGAYEIPLLGVWFTVLTIRGNVYIQNWSKYFYTQSAMFSFAFSGTFILSLSMPVRGY